jgi:glycosyltransferase involved in cell wall biosynthesis
MKLCFIADGRSPIARDWIGYFARGRHQVHVLSTFACGRDAIPGAEIHELIPAGESGSGSSGGIRRRLRSLGWSAGIHDGLVQPMKAAALAATARNWVRRLAPDLLHSLRLPIEGYLGAATGFAPHLISAWGNDFTLYAGRYWLHGRLTRHAVAHAQGFLADARADLERARAFGLPAAVPTLCVPGAGGVDGSVFFPPAGGADGREPLVVNPRGFRRYVRNDTYFAACRILADADPELRFMGVAMAGWPRLEQMVKRLGLGERMTLTGALPRSGLAALYRRARVMVSPTEHDGTPNSLLEAMACGALPVCGDLPSIREWVADGGNGLLTPVDDPRALAQAIRRALDDTDLRRRAHERNPEIIARRASYADSMEEAAEFYERIRTLARTPAAFAAPGAAWKEVKP